MDDIAAALYRGFDWYELPISVNLANQMSEYIQKKAPDLNDEEVSDTMEGIEYVNFFDDIPTPVDEHWEKYAKRIIKLAYCLK